MEKPRQSNYDLRTDKGKMEWNNAIDEYIKQNIKQNKRYPSIIHVDTIYENTKKQKAYKFYY